MKVHNYNKEEEWVAACLELFRKIQPQTVALSGGETPKKVYLALKEAKLNKKIEYFQTDERLIPKDRPESNYRLIVDNLAPENFYPLDQNYNELLPEALDLCILGIGVDGHTASLFPHGPELNTKQKIIKTQSENAAIKERLSLSFLPILKAKNLLVLLKGKHKAPIIEELKNPTKTIEEFPAHKLRQHPNLQILFLT